MTLVITNDSKPNTNNQWKDRPLTWKESGPAHDTWAVPGTALAKESKNSLSVSNEAKLGNNNATWDEYNISYDESLPDTWDTQGKVFLTNESKN